MTKRALLLVNRNSRKGQKSLAQAVNTLDELDFELITIPIKSPEQLTKAVRDKASQVDLVIIGGGDGTLNQVVDSLVETNLPLGVLPLGTANDLARTLGLPLSIPEACKVIAKGNLKYIDLGWVNGKHFFNVASMGLSVDITEKLTKGFKRRWGVLAYGLTALQVLRNTHPFKATLHLGEETSDVKTIQIAVGNGRYYGGGMAIAKHATIDDQQLDIYSLEIERWWQIFPLIWTFHSGEQGQFPWVRCLTGQKITVETRQPQLINTDGEILTETPAEFRVIPRALGVFVKAP